jgi:hypothetical protein
MRTSIIREISHVLSRQDEYNPSDLIDEEEEWPW